MSDKEYRAKVGVIVGSASDMPHAEKAAATFESLGVRYEMSIASAHRTPVDVVAYAENAAGRGIEVIIAIAGLSAALPGVIAAHTTLPVFGVPVSAGTIGGIDALLSVAQMPPGVPVGSLGIDGAKNAALLAARVLALSDDDVKRALEELAATAAGDVRASRNRIPEQSRVPAEAYAAISR